jgi:putative copper export protein
VGDASFTVAYRNLPESKGVIAMSLSLALRFLHVLAAATWLGGMLFIALVLVPVARRLEPPVRTRLVHETGRRFRTVGWIAVGVLVSSGLLNLWLRPELLSAPRFHWKLALVVAALALSAVHDFVLGPRAGRPDADPSLRARASWIARLNVVVVLVVVALGLALRG